jgi:muconolactone delta-isomerase
MKFLTIGNLKDTASTAPPAVMRQLLETSMATMNQQKKAGKLLEMYSVAGWNRVMVISEAKSAEEIVQNISESPITPFYNMEVYPLADLNEVAKIMLERLKAAEKMMPASPR